MRQFRFPHPLLLLLLLLFLQGCSPYDYKKEIKNAQKAAALGNWQLTLSILNNSKEEISEQHDASALALRALASFQVDKNQAPQVLEDLRQARALQPERYDLAYLHGWILLLLNRTKEAQDPLEIAYQLYSDNLKKETPFPESVAGALPYCLGECYRRNNQYDKAIHYFLTAMKYPPYAEEKDKAKIAKNPQIQKLPAILHNNLACLYTKKGDYSSAYRHAVQAYNLYFKNHREESLQITINLAVIQDLFSASDKQFRSTRISWYREADSCIQQKMQTLTSEHDRKIYQELSSHIRARLTEISPR